MKNIIKLDDLLSVDSHLKKASKNYLIPVLLTFCGIGSLIVAPMAQHMDILMMSLFVIGIATLLFGIIGIFLPSNRVIHTESKESLKKYTIFFNVDEENAIKQKLAAGDYQDLLDRQKNISHSKHMATIYATPSRSFCIAQMYEFVPYEYQPYMEPLVYSK